MRDCYCSHCGKKQPAKLDEKSKIIVNCPKCKKPLLLKRDKTGVTVKSYDKVDMTA